MATKKSPSAGELVFLQSLKEAGIPEPEREYRFHQERKWRFDYAWPNWMLALEVEGGVWIGGRHNSPVGFLRDKEKYNEAGVLGWIVLKAVPKELTNGDAVRLLIRVFKEDTKIG